jgi:hypothetical protein
MGVHVENGLSRIRSAVEHETVIAIGELRRERTSRRDDFGE